MSNVRNLQGAALTGGTIADYLEGLKQESAHYNKAIVMLIDDRSGQWKTVWTSHDLKPIEVNFALDLAKMTCLEYMVSEG